MALRPDRRPGGKGRRDASRREGRIPCLCGYLARGTKATVRHPSRTERSGCLTCLLALGATLRHRGTRQRGGRQDNAARRAGALSRKIRPPADPKSPVNKRFATVGSSRPAPYPAEAQFAAHRLRRARSNAMIGTRPLSFFDPLHLGEQAKLFADDTFKKKARPAFAGRAAHPGPLVSLRHPGDPPGHRSVRELFARQKQLPGAGRQTSLSRPAQVRTAIPGTCALRFTTSAASLIGRGVIQVQRKDLKFTGAVG